MKKLPLKETRAPYTVTLDDATLAQEAMLVTQDGAPLGVLVPMEEYADYQVWRRERPEKPHIAQAAFEYEKQAFERMKPELLQKYSGRVVAIYQGQVIQVSDGGETLADFAVRVYRRRGYLPIYFQLVEGKSHVYKFPYRKAIR